MTRALREQTTHLLILFTRTGTQAVMQIKTRLNRRVIGRCVAAAAFTALSALISVQAGIGGDQADAAASIRAAPVADVATQAAAPKPDSDRCSGQHWPFFTDACLRGAKTTAGRVVSLSAPATVAEPLPPIAVVPATNSLPVRSADKPQAIKRKKIVASSNRPVRRAPSETAVTMPFERSVSAYYPG